MTQRIALVGNPNTGKTTFFNNATGQNRHIGNWHGVTIEPTAYRVKDKNCEVVDLAGTYSLSAFSLEERLTSNFILQNKMPIFNICEQENLRRNLMLSLQLLELDCKVSLIINNFGKKTNFDVDNLKNLLGCEVAVLDFFNKKQVLSVFDLNFKNVKTDVVNYLNYTPYLTIKSILNKYKVDFAKLNDDLNKKLKSKSNEKTKFFKCNKLKNLNHNDDSENKTEKQNDKVKSDKCNFKQNVNCKICKFIDFCKKNKPQEENVSSCEFCSQNKMQYSCNAMKIDDLLKNDKSFIDLFVSLRIIEGNFDYLNLYDINEKDKQTIVNLVNDECIKNIYSLRFKKIDEILCKCNYLKSQSINNINCKKNQKIDNNFKLNKTSFIKNNSNLNSFENKNDKTNTKNFILNNDNANGNKYKNLQNENNKILKINEDKEQTINKNENKDKIFTNEQTKQNKNNLTDKKSILKVFKEKIQIKKNVNNKKEKNSNKKDINLVLDKVFLNKYLAIPIFLLIVLIVFYITFGSVGAYISEKLEWLLNAISVPIINAIDATGINFIHSLFVGGILGGVGSIISFLPQVILLFLCLTVLEESGYMARLAYLLEGICNKVGLSGKSVFTFLMGYGCTATALLTAENLDNKSAKLKTILATPYMACSAKLPVFAVIGGAFFGASNVLVIFGLYILSAVVGIVMVNVLDKSILPNKENSFLLEFPPYRVPKGKVLVKSALKNTGHFLSRVGGYILVFSIVIWFLQSFTIKLNYIENGTEEISILQTISQFIAPIFEPLGFGEWGAVSALLAGLVAKELIVSSIGIINNVGVGDIDELVGISLLAESSVVHFSSLSVISFLTFCLLYTPCIATISAMKSIIGTKWTIFSVVSQLIIAYVCSYFLYKICLLFSGFNFLTSIFILLVIIMLCVCGVYLVLYCSKKFKSCPYKNCK